MRTGRPAKERQAALEWLKIYMSRGPALSSQLRRDALVGWRTLQTAKAELGIKSQKTEQGWLWYLPDTTLNVTKLPQTNSVSTVTQPINPDDEPEEEYKIQMDTKAIISMVQELILNGEKFAAIEREALLSCTQWPMPEPYSREYILQVVKKAYNGDN